MSPSRPGGGDDNILAMLERDAGRGRGSRFSSHPHVAWYAGAGAVVVAMVAALGWLAWENATKTRTLPVEMVQVVPVDDNRVAVVPPAPAAALNDAGQPLPSAQAAATLQAVQPLPHAPATASIDAGHRAAAPTAVPAQREVAIVQTTGAAIIDSPAAAAEAPVQLAQAETHATSMREAPAQVAQRPRLPPLVLLPPEEEAPTRTPTAPAAAAARPKPAVAVPPQLDADRASRPSARADAAPAPRRADKVDAVDVARSRAAAKAPPRRVARPAIVRTRKAHTHATPADAPDASADTDVALISAIIMHSSKHAAERAKADAAKSCDGAKCAAKPAAQH